MPETSDARTLSPIKRLLGLLVLLIVIISSMALGLRIARGPASIASQTPGTIPPIVLYILGTLVLLLGFLAYSIVLATGCFTFNYSRPYYRGLRPRLVVINIFVPLLLQAGFSIMMAPTAERILTPLLPAQFVMPAAFLGPFVCLQLFMSWTLVWAPLERILIRRRAKALGITPQQIAAAHMIGISDPTQNSFKKFGGIEDDVGLLFLADDRLGYRGDAVSFDILRTDLLDIERKADAGATSSYFGAVHVILVTQQPDGTTKRIRLHPQGNYTMTANARALDDLANTLNAWKSQLPRSAGFPIAT